MKKIYWIIVALLCLIATVKAALALPINVSCGSNYSFSFVNLTNETEVQDFFCNSTNCTSCQNCSNSTCLLNQSFFNFSLDPGQTYLQNSSQCFISGSCKSSNATNKCVIDRDLNDGDHYTNSGGACDIDILCEDTTDDCEPNTVENFVKDMKLYTEDDKVIFFWDGNQQTFLKNSSFNYETNVKFSCPARIVKNETCECDNECSSDDIVGLDIWLDKMESKVGQCDGARDDLGECLSQKIEMTDENRECEKSLICKTQLQAVQNSFDQCLMDGKVKDGEVAYYWAFIVLLAIWAGMATLLSLMLSFFLWRSKHSTVVALQTNHRTKQINNSGEVR